MKIGVKHQAVTACKQYCLAAGATQGNIAYTQTVTGKRKKTLQTDNGDEKWLF